MIEAAARRPFSSSASSMRDCLCVCSSVSSSLLLIASPCFSTSSPPHLFLSLPSSLACSKPHRDTHNTTQKRQKKKSDSPKVIGRVKGRLCLVPAIAGYLAKAFEQPRRRRRERVEHIVGHEGWTVHVGARS